MQGIIISNIHSIELYNSEVTYDIIMKLVLWALKAVYVFKKKHFPELWKIRLVFRFWEIWQIIGYLKIVKFQQQA